MAEPEPETYTLQEAADALGVSADDVRSYIEEGLVVAEPDGANRPALSRANMRRLWTVVTLHRDLGINLPGVSAVLRLREQYERVHRDLATLVEIVERELGPDAWDRLWPEDRPTPHANVSVEGVAETAGPEGAGPGGSADRSSGPSRQAADADATSGADDAPRDAADTDAASEDGGGAHPPDQDADT